MLNARIAVNCLNATQIKQGENMIRLTDDGTMDTVIECSDCEQEFRGNYDGGSSVFQDDSVSEITEHEAELRYQEYISEFIKEVEEDHICARACAICGDPIDPDRIRLAPRVKTCDRQCSKDLRRQNVKHAVEQYRIRRDRKYRTYIHRYGNPA